MATRFSATLFGDDNEHLEAVAAAVEDETRRLDNSLSRFDPTSEISRVNREAADRFVRVNVDVWELLESCEKYRQKTCGFFDVTAGSARDGMGPRLLFDPAQRAVRFASPGVRIDLGAIGKGYALEQAKAILRRFNVRSACLNAGDSSILTMGRFEVGVPDPRSPRHLVELAPTLSVVSLEDRGLSFSATRHPDQSVSDLIDPTTGRPVDKCQCCLTIAETATEAEAYSTALLVMGRRRATRFLEENEVNRIQVSWIDADAASPQLVWLTERLFA